MGASMTDLHPLMAIQFEPRVDLRTQFPSLGGKSFCVSSRAMSADFNLGKHFFGTWLSIVVFVSLYSEVLPQARVICQGNRIITNIIYRARDVWAPRIAANFTPLYLKDPLDIVIIILKNSRVYNASNVYLEGEVGESSTLSDPVVFRQREAPTKS